jgi:hypothetical protein
VLQLSWLSGAKMGRLTLCNIRREKRDSRSGSLSPKDWATKVGFGVVCNFFFVDNGNIAAAPHNFGSCLSCYTTLHLASALGCSVEWDIGESDAFDTSAYGPVRDGKVKIPEEPGFGIRLNDQIFKSCKDCWIVQ